MITHIFNEYKFQTNIYTYEQKYWHWRKTCRLIKVVILEAQTPGYDPIANPKIRAPHVLCNNAV